MVSEKTKKEKGKAKPQAALTPGQKVSRELLSWFWVILAFIFIEGTLVQARVIPSGSMENTILIGDHLMVSRFGYDAGIPFTDDQITLWRNPKRQQVIVFAAPPGEGSNQDLIKRVIGIPGDSIQIRHGAVFVNGQQLKEPYILRDPDDGNSFVENFPPDGNALFDGRLNSVWAATLSRYVVNGQLRVPPEHYFVMGDNRGDSYDSRYWGFVPRQNIIGTPLFIYMSIDAPEQVWEPGHIGERLGTYLSILIHPGEMRWKRLFRTF
ncbi:MAG TPA: signal peptidase I [Candidatus Acidoferrales bacterium]|nr:signal peptidase I [Candidatus Acidoferrales bacterium]